MKIVENWNGKSVSFFAKLEDPPLPIPALMSPARLFNISFNADGSLYTAYFGSGLEVEERHVSAGSEIHRKTDAFTQSRECRISIHGSGEVRSFIRGEGEVISHLGYELRTLADPVIVAEHRISTAGEYMPDPFGVQNPKTSAVIVPGIFEQPLQPIFSIHVAPEGFHPQGSQLIWAGRTKPMDNGRCLNVAVQLRFENWPEKGQRGHEIRVLSNSESRVNSRSVP